MCGIAGYIGSEPAGPIVLEALRRLEYRGYDSSGIAALDGSEKIVCHRRQGKLDRLEESLQSGFLSGTVAIGHTRWATHGKPTEENAHPHIAGKVAVVHNGIIENFGKLREELVSRGCRFASETDTEVVPHLVNRFMEDGMDPVHATRATIARLEGAFALALLFEGRDDMLIVARKGSPLVLGFGNSGSFIGSDEYALTALADRILYLEEGDMAVVARQGTTVYDANGATVEREMKPARTADLMVSKGNYPHFMLKEIHEQPDAVGNTLRSVSDPVTHRVRLPELPFNFTDISAMTISACGTASYAGLVAKYWLESKRIARLRTEWDLASEFRYREPILDPGTLGLVISQSGETADTKAALEYMQSQGCRTLSVVNVARSAIARLSLQTGGFIQTQAGPEIGVASTKAFTTQLAVLAALAIQAGRERGVIDERAEREFTSALDALPASMQNALALDPAIRDIAESIVSARDVFYVGRGTSFALALEGALKLKEISYIHAEGYAAGELKHGPISLLEDGVPVIGIAPYDEHDNTLFEKTASNLQEMAARGGRIILLSDQRGCDELSKYVWKTVVMPETNLLTSPIIYSLPLQLLAYHVAVLKGNDVDQPRNLAKSVTVE